MPHSRFNHTTLYSAVLNNFIKYSFVFDERHTFNCIRTNTGKDAQFKFPRIGTYIGKDAQFAFPGIETHMGKDVGTHSLVYKITWERMHNLHFLIYTLRKKAFYCIQNEMLLSHIVPFHFDLFCMEHCIQNELLLFKLECYHSILHPFMLVYSIWNKCTLNKILPFKMKCCHSIFYPYI